MIPRSFIDISLYFQELLRKMENPRIRNAAKEVYIARERLEIGALLGKGKRHCSHVMLSVMAELTGIFACIFIFSY
jgi:hypothetical protein